MSEDIFALNGGYNNWKNKEIVTCGEVSLYKYSTYFCSSAQRIFVFEHPMKKERTIREQLHYTTALAARIHQPLY